MFSTAPPAFCGHQNTLRLINKWLKTDEYILLLIPYQAVRSVNFVNFLKLSAHKITNQNSIY